MLTVADELIGLADRRWRWLTLDLTMTEWARLRLAINANDSAGVDSVVRAAMGSSRGPGVDAAVISLMPSTDLRERNA